MKVLITGAAGVLGGTVASLLEEGDGIELRLTDTVPLETSHESVQADLSKCDEVEGLCDGIDEVLHIAAIHPWKQYTPEQYIDCNIKGTFNVLNAAANAGVKRVIYTSSIAAVGYGLGPGETLPFDESKPWHAVEDIYSISKQTGEQFCEMFWRKHQLPYVALRPGTFIPRDEDDPQFGLGLLLQWVHFSDVAQAHVLALKSDVRNEAIFITAKVPFTKDDGPALLTDARPVILKHFPDAAQLEAQGLELPRTIPRCYSIEKAERLLGFRPALSFGEWLRKKIG